MKKKSPVSIALIIVSIFFLFFINQALNLSVGSKIAWTLRPFGIVFEQFGATISGNFSNLKNIGKLQKENNDLNDKLNKALAEIAVLTEAQKENSALKRDLGFKENNSYELVAGNILFFDPSNIRDTITINIGKNKGIKDGNVVISEGFLVGKIINVSDTSAKIKLISDPDSAIPVSISQSSINGLVKGRIGNGLSLEQVPQSEKVNMEDVIVTSGLGGDFPKGIIVGRVEEVQRASGSIFQQISVRPVVDLTKLERVMVIKN